MQDRPRLSSDQDPKQEENLGGGSQLSFPLQRKQKLGYTIKTPNIFATSHRLPETLDQYFISSRCAPSTFSTTSSVLASILWICSLRIVSILGP